MNACILSERNECIYHNVRNIYRPDMFSGTKIAGLSQKNSASLSNIYSCIFQKVSKRSKGHFGTKSSRPKPFLFWGSAVAQW